MAAVAITYTFSAGTTASASEVNQDFTDLVNYINNRNDATATWDRLSVASSTAVPLIANNSTGTANIANFQDNGTNVLIIADGGASTFTANGGSGVALTVNGGTSTGNVFQVQDNGTSVFEIEDGGTSVFNEAGTGTADVRMEGDAQANLFFLDASADTIIFGGAAIGAGTVLYTNAGGFQFGQPTGGDKGGGTINVATEIYKNNTAYANPDYAFEHYFTGKIDKFKDNDGASDYKGLLPLNEAIEYCKKHLDLPRVKSFRVDNGGQGIFARADIALEKIEEAYLYIFQIHERLKVLEGN